MWWCTFFWKKNTALLIQTDFHLEDDKVITTEGLAVIYAIWIELQILWSLLNYS